MQFLKNYFFLQDVEYHKQTKEILLREIEGMGEFSLFDDSQRISNTNYHLARNVLTELFNSAFVSTATNHFEVLRKMLGYQEIFLKHFWYQQYEEGDYHKWHNHGDSLFSSVYYVELPEGASKTTFQLMGEEIELEVKEGQILTFPSFIPHCSKPNQSKSRKTVIAFNSVGNVGKYLN